MTRLTLLGLVTLLLSISNAGPASATCGTRPTPCPFGSCNSVDWILNGTFADGTCAWTLYNVAVTNGSGICGSPGNSYLQFKGNYPSLTYVSVSQGFDHDPDYTDDDFYLFFVLQGSGSSASTYLNVWIWNQTDNDWYLADTIDSTDGTIYCANRFYPFYNTDWVGKTLYVVFEGYVNNTADWRIDYVALDQGE
jgi:hypothetical protein